MELLKQKQYHTPSVTIHYWTTDKSDKPTIFLMHGAAMDHGMFESQLEVLQNYNVISWDARGHGESRPVQGVFSIHDLANDAIAILSDLKINKAIFVGQSEGGMIAQEVYRINPSIVTGIVSIGGSPIMLRYSKMDIYCIAQR